MRGPGQARGSAPGAQSPIVWGPVVLAVAAQLIWGSFPVYWAFLGGIDPFVTAAHRVLWSCATVVLLLVVSGRARELLFVALPRRMFFLSAVAALALGINWAAFAVGVHLERFSEVSLGFYMNPIVTMLLAVVFLRERLSAGLVCVLGLGFMAIIILTFSYGRFPVVAVVLALSFGAYSLVKKRLSAGPLTELYLETVLLVPIAVIFLCIAQSTRLAVIVGNPFGIALLLVGAGVISVLPLVLFANSVKRIPLALTGVVQYVSPTVQLLVAVSFFGEELNWRTILGFCLVWVAIMIYVFLGARGPLSSRFMRFRGFRL